MQVVPILTQPNQTFSVNVDSNRYTLLIKEAGGCMVVSITRNDVVLIDSVRAVAGYPLIPYLYIEDGNFIFTTENDALPYWDQFNISQNLYYVSAIEMAAIRG